MLKQRPCPLHFALTERLDGLVYFDGVSRLNDSGNHSTSTNDVSLTDGALDTLGSIFNIFGSESFPLDSDTDTYHFRDLCMEVVRHIENGSAAPQIQIDQANQGVRQWSHVRRFFADRRQRETTFVNDRLYDYRGVVADLVTGLRQICEHGDTTEQRVLDSLRLIENAADGGQLPEIERALATTVDNITEAFTQQKLEYEQQIHTLNERMSGLRQDLMAAHEEMKLDSLTAVFNRGAFDSSIARSLNMRFVLGQPTSLIMIDVDNFKTINDSFGHTVGDEVLKSVAACLSRAFVRKNDMVFRYGGDEFAILLPDTTTEQARVSVERFLKNACEIRFQGQQDNVEISCSAGCTEIDDDDAVESAISRADRALYDAKQAGRNCLKIRLASTS